MDVCPQCHRKLLTHASLKCSWCGAEITDPTYQAEAMREREAFDFHDEQRIALEESRIANLRFQNNTALLFGGGGFTPIGPDPVHVDHHTYSRRIEPSADGAEPLPVGLPTESGEQTPSGGEAAVEALPENSDGANSAKP